MPFEIRIEDNFDEFERTVDEEIEGMQEQLQYSQEELWQMALEHLKEEAPVRTGEFRESLVAEALGATEWWLHSEHPKARMIIEGTKSSPGLYIKKEKKNVGKRLTRRSGRKDIGMHPGTPPHPIFRRTYNWLLWVIRRLLDRIAGRWR